jgi:hypothetical protein
MNNDTGKLLSGLALLFAFIVIGLSACSTTETRSSACALPSGPDVERAIAQAKADLSDGCAYQFDAYYDELLRIAEGDPGPVNKERFSEFLLWATEQGLISKRQAQMHYNRYFNVKFIALMGDYNTCSQTCPSRLQVLSDMESELLDKERGLLKVAGDAASYYRADQLLKETELVLEATCRACGDMR